MPPSANADTDANAPAIVDRPYHYRELQLVDPDNHIIVVGQCH